jgi:hypothetical protein
VPYPVQIVESQGQPVIVILSQRVHNIRNIDMGREHLDGLDLWMGDSRGRRDGERPRIDLTADFHSDAIHVVERFKPLDSNNIAYEATIEVPKVYTRAWKIACFGSRVFDPKYEALEFACIEGERDISIR